MTPLLLARTSLIAALCVLGGCAARQQPIALSEPVPAVTVVAEPEWRGVITPGDLERLESLKSEWAEALAAVRSPRETRTVAAEMPLLDPDAALELPAPPPGHYRCRIVRLMSGMPRGGQLKAFKSFSCYIGNDGARLSFTKETGSDRPAGWFWEDGDKRLVFLGALVAGAESTVPAYGEDAARDLAGVIERVAPFRWRLVLPAPVRESRLDIIELVPNLPAADPAPAGV